MSKCGMELPEDCAEVQFTNFFKIELFSTNLLEILRHFIANTLSVQAFLDTLNEAFSKSSSPSVESARAMKYLFQYLTHRFCKEISSKTYEKMPATIVFKAKYRSLQVRKEKMAVIIDLFSREEKK